MLGGVAVLDEFELLPLLPHAASATVAAASDVPHATRMRGKHKAT